MTPKLQSIFLDSPASTYCRAYTNEQTGNLFKGKSTRPGDTPSHAVLCALGEREVRQACILVAFELGSRYTDKSIPKSEQLGYLEARQLEVDLMNLDTEQIEHEGREWTVVW